MVREYSKSKDGGLRLTENFRLSELDCKCSRCDRILLDESLVELLQKIREHFGVPVNVNSGYRCPEHNAEVGGSSTSHHMRGMAADIVVKGIAPKEVAKYAESIGIQRIGLYDGFVHIGSDEKKRFWLGHEGVEVDTFGEAAVTLTLPVLKKGDKLGAVFGLQALLLGYGYDLGEKPLDGSFGSKTKAAVEKFRFERDLPASGVVDKDTWRELLGV